MKQPEQLVEHFMRHEATGLVAALTRAFGFSLIDVVEEMVQESLLEALRSWRIRGVPENPSAWLRRVARNKVIDAMRRGRTQAELSDAQLVELPGRGQAIVRLEPDELQDGLLRMIFACCHPMLDRRSQLALSLKVLCGLGDHEIARGLMVNTEAARKRVARAKRQLQLARISLELPPPALLAERMDAVHEVLYLMFNEGYSPTRGAKPVRIDLCEEAARLCHLLCTAEIGLPATRALLALILFHAARLESRTGEHGQALLLEEQDRSLWDRDMIQIAESWFHRSASGADLTKYHLEAGIAKFHCDADSLDETDWNAIHRHYELLAQLFPSPLYRLNQAIVLGKLNRAVDGLAILSELEHERLLDNYALLYCAIASLQFDLGELDKARTSWQRALKLVTSDHERSLIQSKLQQISDAAV